MPAALADTAVTPALLLDEVRRARAAAEAAEARIMELAVEWAHAHPVLEGGEGWQITTATGVAYSEVDGTALALDPTDPAAEELVEWCGIPPVAWDAPAAFAAANKMFTAAGKRLIRDALILHHRLPRTWARVTGGEVPAWRARRVAEAVLAAPADVVAYVDDQIAPVVGTIGTVTLDQVVERAMTLLHAEAREADQACATESHEVRFHGDAQPDGTAELFARGDYKDLHDLHQTLTHVAAALKAAGDDTDLDVRRARALGILADPAQALALLAGREAPTLSKQAVLYLHLTDLALLGLDPVALNDTTRHAMLTAQVRDWLARTDTHVVVKPVLDLAEDLHTESYAIPTRLREQTQLLHPTCVFPFCTRPSRRCDLDHIDAWDSDPENPGGATCSHNLAPLCRHHHRLKTHTPWTYRRLDTRLFLWTDPHGIHYLRDHASTSLVDRTVEDADGYPAGDTPTG
ncbi:HNH endonuclease signature motif containing protein [Nocardioides plantarum]|uniref:HNH endonuclease signature motif containing protein n=1 Tax=Nocardioides plantarum TaxID=29299 RepID=A0ABV5K9C5_9ACTN|nr:HNH endonuclease signature motif containing protein [Nocardioides plantarum]